MKKYKCTVYVSLALTFDIESDDKNYAEHLGIQEAAKEIEKINQDSILKVEYAPQAEISKTKK
jgi:hypothetical protein